MRVWPVMDTDVTAWAATIDEPAGPAALTPREALLLVRYTPDNDSAASDLRSELMP